MTSLVLGGGGWFFVFGVLVCWVGLGFFFFFFCVFFGGFGGGVFLVFWVLVESSPPHPPSLGLNGSVPPFLFFSQDELFPLFPISVLVCPLKTLTQNTFS